MKNFRPKSSNYEVLDLINMDSYLYDLYSQRRPYFFTQMMLDKLNNSSAVMTVDEKFSLMNHLILYGLQFDSSKNLQLQKLLALIHNHYKIIKTENIPNDPDCISKLLVVRSFLAENKIDTSLDEKLI